MLSSVIDLLLLFIDRKCTLSVTAASRASGLPIIEKKKVLKLGPLLLLSFSLMLLLRTFRIHYWVY
jgi:hypothetical protein